jgi:hypothetical protein
LSSIDLVIDLAEQDADDFLSERLVPGDAGCVPRQMVSDVPEDGLQV